MTPTPELRERLRLLLGDSTEPFMFTDAELDAILRQSPTFDEALALGWQVLSVKLAGRMRAASFGSERYEWPNPMELARWAQDKADKLSGAGGALLFSSMHSGRLRREGEVFAWQGGWWDTPVPPPAVPVFPGAGGGAPGPAGPAGPPGARGTQFFTGDGAPADPFPDAQGGDLYLNRQDGNLYRFEDGTFRILQTST